MNRPHPFPLSPPHLRSSHIANLLKHSATVSQQTRTLVRHADDTVIVNRELQVAHEVVLLELRRERTLRRRGRPRVKRTEPGAECAADSGGVGTRQGVWGGDEEGLEVCGVGETFQHQSEGFRAGGEQVGCADGDVVGFACAVCGCGLGEAIQ